MGNQNHPDSRGRRNVLKKIGAAATAGAVGIVGLKYASQPAFAIQSQTLSANNVMATTDDGTISDVYVKPDLTYAFEGLDAEPGSIDFLLEVQKRGSSTHAQLADVTDNNPPQSLTSSDGTYTFQKRHSILGSGWQKSDFTSDTDGQVVESDPIPVRIEGQLKTSSDTYTDQKTAEFTVKVKNKDPSFGGGSGGGIGGNVGSGVTE